MQPDAREPYSFRDDPAVPAFDASRIVLVMDADCALCSQAARRIAPKVSASERPDAGRYRFDISIGLPWGRAPVLRYHGWLDVAQAADEGG